MASTYTPSNRFDLQGTGDNPSTWGQRLNERVFAMVDEALDGVTELDITVTTSYTLSTASGTTDQARKRVLVISGTATANATVTVPALSKMYVVECKYTGAYTVTVKTAGDAGVVLKAGDGAILYVTASGVFDVLRKSEMLIASNNLTDLTDKVAARAALGLGNPTINQFTNDGTTTVRTLTQDPGTINAVTVVFDGVVQTPTTDYTLSGTTLTYTTAPANGTKELIFIGSQSLPAGVTSDGSVTIPKLSSSVYATNAEATAGTDNTKVMTPLRVKEAIAVNPAPLTTFSSVRVATANGAGSTNTKIRRFSATPISTTGSDITYADSATLGASFTINADGVYAITYTDNFSVPNDGFGISLNSNQLTTSIFSINIAARLVTSWQDNNNNPISCSVTLKLSAGDVIRPHLGTSVGTSLPDLSSFIITRIA